EKATIDTCVDDQFDLRSLHRRLRESTLDRLLQKVEGRFAVGQPLAPLGGGICQVEMNSFQRRLQLIFENGGALVGDHRLDRLIVDCAGRNDRLDPRKFHNYSPVGEKSSLTRCSLWMSPMQFEPESRKRSVVRCWDIQRRSTGPVVVR